VLCGTKRTLVANRSQQLRIILMAPAYGGDLSADNPAKGQHEASRWGKDPAHSASQLGHVLRLPKPIVDAMRLKFLTDVKASLKCLR
jgi:hypothetical protein